MRRIKRWVLPRWADESGSLALAVMLSLVGVTLSTLTVPVVVNQLSSSRETIQRARSLHAAQAGLDVGLAHLRASGGSVAKLICYTQNGNPLVGAVDTSNERYKVWIDYLDADRNRFACTPGGQLNLTPWFAQLHSIGSDNAAFGDGAHTRTLEATYVFRFTNENIVGGQIRLSGDVLCLDAGSGSPSPGTNLQLQACNPGSPRQTLAYNKSLTLSLASSKSVDNPLGMCLEAGTPPANGMLVQFQRCGSVITPRQQWSLNDDANFQGTTNGTTLNTFCFKARSIAAGSFVELNTCAADSTRVFSPEASVGAGAAGAASDQLVNYEQFGRCMDVTLFDVTLGFLIAWPCKQAPTPSTIGWNQRWTLPAVPTDATSGVGLITTTNTAGTQYCLKNVGLASAPQFVQVTTCPAAAATPAQIPTQFRWTRFTDTGDYATSHVIQDGMGRCLTPTDLTKTAPTIDYYNGSQRVSKLTLVTCTDSTLQKWNAPANIQDPLPLNDMGEK